MGDHPSFFGWVESVSEEVELELEEYQLAAKVLQVAARRTILEAAAPSVEGKLAWVVIGCRKLACGTLFGGFPSMQTSSKLGRCACARRLPLLKRFGSQCVRLWYKLVGMMWSELTHQARGGFRTKYAAFFSMWAASKQSVCRIVGPQSDGSAARIEEEGVELLQGRIGGRVCLSREGC